MLFRRVKKRRDIELLQKYFSWVIISCHLIFVTELFRGSLWGFLLYGFPDENQCLMYLLYLMHLVVLVILSYKDPI